MENNQEIKVGIDIPRINYIKHHYLYPTVRVISNLSNDTVKEVLMNVYKTMETLDRTRVPTFPKGIVKAASVWYNRRNEREVHY